MTQFDKVGDVATTVPNNKRLCTYGRKSNDMQATTQKNRGWIIWKSTHSSKFNLYYVGISLDFFSRQVN